MKVYRILFTTMQGKAVYSDPIDTGDKEHDEIVRVLDKIVELVAEGAYLQVEVDGTKRTYLNHAIESIWWTEGS